MADPVGAIPVNVDAAVQRGPLSWLRNSGIVKLNCILVLSLISSYATGFDGSMVGIPVKVAPNECPNTYMDGLDEWTPVFGHLEY